MRGGGGQGARGPGEHLRRHPDPQARCARRPGAGDPRPPSSALCAPGAPLRPARGSVLPAGGPSRRPAQPGGDPRGRPRAPDEPFPPSQPPTASFPPGARALVFQVEPRGKQDRPDLGPSRGWKSRGSAYLKQTCPEAGDARREAFQGSLQGGGSCPQGGVWRSPAPTPAPLLAGRVYIVGPRPASEGARPGAWAVQARPSDILVPPFLAAWLPPGCRTPVPLCKDSM